MVVEQQQIAARMICGQRKDKISQHP